jgi:TetR/AcrR family transcriptional repressor of mexJK operon
MASLSNTLTRPTRDQRREAILLIAHDVFLEHGFEGASMSQVAARLGGSKGTLYSYFDSKEALFEALVAESCTQRGPAMFDVNIGLPMAERLTGIARAYVALVGSEWSVRMLQVVAAEARRRPEVGRLFYESGPGAAVVRLSAELEGFAAAGLLEFDDRRQAAETFFILCRGTLHLLRMLGQAPVPTPELIEREAARAVAQFLRLYGIS